MNRTIAWLGLALVAAPVLAQPTPAPQEQPTKKTARPQVSVDFRPEYLAGEPILLRFEVSNQSTETTRFADLSSRPHLVRFDLTGPDGKKQTRFNTPPPIDPGRLWELSPRSRRQVLLQVPSSRGFKPGRWSVTIRILDDSGEITLPSHDFLLKTPRPVAGSLVRDELGLERTGHQAVWVHKAQDGYDLYLHHSQGKRPEKTLGDYYLLHLDDRIEPVLSHSRPQERWGRYIYWQVDDKTISYVQLDGQRIRGKVRKLQMPWPAASLLARGTTDADGSLHLPLWINAPQGTGGEIRVASVRSQAGTRFRSVVRLPRAPAWVESTIDASGALRLLVAHDGFLDLYTVDPKGDLPAVGRRLSVDLAPQAARFGFLPDQEDQAGGLAILGLYRSEAGLVGRWTSLSGRTIHDFAVVIPPPSTQLQDLLPLGLAPFAALYQATGDLPAQLIRPGHPQKSLQARSEGVLISNGEGAVLLRQLDAGRPIETRRLVDGTP
jgi:hypothetical protein